MLYVDAGIERPRTTLDDGAYAEVGGGNVRMLCHGSGESYPEVGVERVRRGRAVETRKTLVVPRCRYICVSDGIGESYGCLDRMHFAIIRPVGGGARRHQYVVGERRKRKCREMLKVGFILGAKRPVARDRDDILSPLKRYAGRVSVDDRGKGQRERRAFHPDTGDQQSVV